jgi:BRCT domain type II-containing protein
MFDLRTTAIAAAVALALGAVSSWWLTAEYKDNKWMAKVEAQKVEAAKQLQVATEKVIETERKHNAIATKLEIQNANKQTQLDKVQSDNRRLAAQLGGLRDPGRRQSCSSTVSASAGATQQPAPEAADSRLSAEATDFLLEFARDADRAAQYANSCYEWIQQIK